MKDYPGQILNFINYRSVFNSAVSQKQLDHYYPDESERIKALDLLMTRGFIKKEAEYIYSSHLKLDINEALSKSKFALKIIDDHSKTLNRISKLSIVKFIGISGSVAAENPSLKKSSDVDLDIFLIVKKDSVWIFRFFIAMVLNILDVFSKSKHPLCFNYIMDETDLKIYNPNYFTATEIANLKVYYDDGIYDKFLETNNWYNNYYRNKPFNNFTI